MEDTSNTTSSALDSIKHLDPCVESQAYLATQSDPATAWRNCQRGDWMLWLAARINLPRPLIVLAACDCVRTALRHTPVAELRPLKAIEAAEAWAANPTEDNRQLVIQARRDAYVAAVAAANAAAAHTAYATAYVAASAYASAAAADAAAHTTAASAYASTAASAHATAADADPAYAAYADAADATAHTVAYAVAAAADADAADAADATAHATAADAARKQAQAQHADLVRARIPVELVMEALASC